MIVDVGRPCSLWAALFPRHRVLKYTERKKLAGKQRLRHYILTLILIVDVKLEVPTMASLT